jgi:hypothetical protein
MRRFLWLPARVHLEQPFMGGYGLGRLRWGWVDGLSEQQRIDLDRRQALLISFASGIAAGGLAIILLSGCK